MTLLGILGVAKVLADIGLASAACWGTFRWLPVVIDRVRLVHDRDEARGEAVHFRDLTNAMGGGASGLIAMIEALRTEVSSMRDQVEEMRAVQIISARYIAALVGHISDGGMSGNMPPIPAELRDDVLEHLRTAQEARTATV